MVFIGGDSANSTFFCGMLTLHRPQVNHAVLTISTKNNIIPFLLNRVCFLKYGNFES
jgi:hypothetical protein